MALLRTSIPDVSLSDLGDPQRLALVSAFRDEVARQVRPAQFSDLQGLIQGLSTGIQGELDKLNKRDERQAGPVAAGRALRLAPRPVFLAGREELLAELEARLAGDDGAGPRVVALCGLGGAGKTSVAVEYAHRHLAEVGVCWQFPAEDPAVLAAGFGELAAQLGAAGGRGPGGLGARGAGRQPGAVAAGVRQRARPGLGGAVRAPGRARAGADHQPEPDLAARPGPGRAGAGPAGGRRSSWSAGPATRTGGRPWSWPVSWAGCRWRWSRPPRTSRPAADSLAGYLASFLQRRAGPAGPRRADRVPRDGGHHLEAGV